MIKKKTEIAFRGQLVIRDGYSGTLMLPCYEAEKKKNCGGNAFRVVRGRNIRD